MKHALLRGLVASAICAGASSLAWSASIDPSNISLTVAEGQTMQLEREVTLDGVGPAASRVDVYFLADNTGSMGGAISSVRNNAQTILSAISGGDSRFTDIDVAYGVASYWGDPREYGGTAETKISRALRLNQPITTASDDVQTAINQWRAGGGGDGPEANFFALHQLATSGGSTDGVGSTDPGLASGYEFGWRDNAVKLIVWFGDIRSHTTTVDRAEVIQALVDNEVIVAAINTRGANRGIDTGGEASDIVAATDGFLAHNIRGSDATVEAILNAVEHATEFVDLSLAARNVPDGIDVSYSCASDVGCDSVAIGESRIFNMTVTGHAVGEYAFETYVPFLADTTSDDIVSVRACLSDLEARGTRSKISVTWTDTGADHYVVYRATDEAGPFEAISTTNNRYSTYGDRNVEKGTTYYYQVKEADASGYEYCESIVTSVSTASRFRPGPINQPPEITSAPVLTATEDLTYSYTVVAEDPENSALTYSLSTAPVGMSMDSSGFITWLPENHQVGTHSVVVTVADDEGLTDSQVFQVSVANTNDAPEFDSTPITFVSVGESYFYAAHAFDVDPGDAIFYSLDESPASMVIDLNTGNIQWEPEYGDGPSQSIIVRATDAQGEFVLQEFTLTVNEPNRAPSITSSPIVTAVTLSAYEYNVEVSDPDAGDNQFFSLLQSPEGMLIDENTGEITWTPSRDQVGNHDVSVQVVDAGSLSDVQNFSISVNRDNTAPEITSTPDLNALEGSTYSYSATAIDAEADTLQWTLVNGPSAMALSATGTITWQPEFADVGDHTVEVLVEDGFGGTDNQTFVITVAAAPNNPPQVTSTPVLEAVRDLPYEYQIQVSDDEGDSIGFSLVLAPAGVSLNATGLVQWSPVFADVGIHPIEIQITDGRNIVNHDYTLTVLAAPSDNQAPVINSTPNTSVLEGDAFSYEVIAVDNNGDAVTLSLSQFPTGMELSGNQVQWPTTTPGLFDVTVVAEDIWSASVEQSFSIEVEANQPPVITSNAVTEVEAGNQYQYQVVVADPENRPVSYSVSGPTGMSIGATGLISWLTSTADEGLHTVQVTAEDHLGLTDIQDFQVTVSVTVTNNAPVIVSTPITTGFTGVEYTYDFNATDADGDTLTYSLVQSPTGMTIVAESGQILWTPEETQAGMHTVEVLVEDGNGGSANQQFDLTITVPINNPPVISSSPVTVATVGNIYQYQFIAADADGDTLSYELLTGPSGMSMDVAGLVQWVPSISQLGNHSVELQVSDGIEPVDQTFSVRVEEVAPLQVTIDLTPAIVDPNELVTIQVNASEAIDPSYSLTIDGGVVAIDSDGVATFSSSMTGTYAVSALVNSSDGATGSASATIRVRNATDTTPPTAIIETPVDGVEIDYLADVIGTATDDNLFEYRLYLGKPGTSDFSQIASSNAQVVSDKLAEIDPSLIPNGLYTLLLMVEDINGLTSQDSIGIRIEGGFKPGRVQLSFVDMTVPLAGIPIVIERTYDSADQSQKDFGVGWDMSVRQGEYVNNREPGRGWGVVDSGGFFKIPCYNSVEQAHHETDIRLSESESYQFRPRINLFGYGSIISGGCLGQAEFVQTGGIGGATLQPLGNTNVFYLNGTDIFTYDLGDLNFGEPWVPSDVRLTTPDGRVFDLNIQSGITRLADTNNNQLFISDSGVVNASGIGVTFSRDAEGRITTIQDPQGNSVHYGYDAESNLVTFTNQLIEDTTYQYHHYPFVNHLKSITLPDGREVSSFGYDESGRIDEACDEDGCSSAEYDLVGRTQTNYDATGRPMVFTYDQQGNVISQLDALGNEQQFSYDLEGNLTEIIDAEGNVTVQTWDENGNLLSRVRPHDVGENPTDFTTNYEWDAAGNLTTVTAPGGGQSISEFDSQNNLLSVTDETGFVLLSFTYDANGRVLSESDQFGSLDIGYDSTGLVNSISEPVGVASSFEHDEVGNITSFTRNGITTNYEYDAMGRMTSHTDTDGTALNLDYQYGSEWLSASGSHMPSIERDFSAKGKPLSITQEGETQISWLYDASGRVLEEVNVYGAKTRFEYDLAGRLNKQFDPFDYETTFDLDKNGRVVGIVDHEGHRQAYEYYPDSRKRSFEDSTGKTWRYSYTPTSATVEDDLLRTVTTHFNPHGLVTSIENADGTSRGWEYLVAHGSLDGGQRPTVFTDEAGRTRTFTYDDLGRIASASDLSGESATYSYSIDGLEQIIDAESQQVNFTRDQNGDVLSVSYNDGVSKAITRNSAGNIDSITYGSGLTKTLAYDNHDRLVSDVRSNGEAFTFEYDVGGALSSVTDNLGNYSFIRDQVGRTTNYSDPNSNQVEYEYNYLGLVANKTITNSDGSDSVGTSYGYDAAGRLVSIVDPLANETTQVFDAAGRMTERHLPNGVISRYAYDVRDQITSISHETSTGAVIYSVDYVRLIGGEPSQITWHDGSYVQLSYDTGLRIEREEFFDSSGTASHLVEYTYDRAGNRTARTVNSINSTYNYGPGGRLDSIVGGNSRTLLYTGDGQISSIQSAIGDMDLGYNFAGQITSGVLDGTSWQHKYDYAGRRIGYTSGTVDRQFVTTRSDTGRFESPQAVLNGNTFVHNYVFAGDTPLQRQDGDQATYYLTDAFGSVVARLDASGSVIGMAKYDAFGNTVEQTGDILGSIDAGGDFGFHGHWFDQDAGLYHMRARHYDPSMGRFMSSDPASPDLQEVESLNRYAFANNNPYVYADPTGRFTLISVNISLNVSGILRTIGISIARDYLLDKARSVVGSLVAGQLKNFAALAGYNPFENPGTKPWEAGGFWERRIREFICEEALPESLREIVWFEVPINGSGYAGGNGLNCGNMGTGGKIKDHSSPDFMLSKIEPVKLGKNEHKSHKAYLIGEVKLSLKTFYNAYVVGSNKTQFNRITTFASKRVYSRIAVFLAWKSGSKSKKLDYMRELMKLLTAAATKKKMVPIMAAAQ